VDGDRHGRGDARKRSGAPRHLKRVIEAGHALARRGAKPPDRSHRCSGCGRWPSRSPRAVWPDAPRRRRTSSIPPAPPIAMGTTPSATARGERQARLTGAPRDRGRERRKPRRHGAFEERLKGLEPSTFCMASSSRPPRSVRFLPATEAVPGLEEAVDIRRGSPLIAPVVSTNCQPEAWLEGHRCPGGMCRAQPPSASGSLQR
jgi:hypothetical protein